ncbi:Aste57867_1757 [Aphanomyces stellatus]|uniref:Aste57867_1757 protein n=1 Tax=Aphanomyces stellatus TaxID=120398 RepID=A0A485K5V1_9STRA|nr:hypothetical protein As57867_001755 [Aphanomyces stellatus]VFT78966.1 Aste57867_1757 [Aphanomyces stellatus]
MAVPVAAVTLAGLYSGAAVYMSVVQHPAILRLRSRRLQGPFFCHMYQSASAFLAPVGLLGSAASFVVWIDHRDESLWALGGSLLLAIVPFTSTKMLALNMELTDPSTWKRRSPRVLQAKLLKWGFLHAVRALASLAATTALVCALHRRSSSSSARC